MEQEALLKLARFLGERFRASINDHHCLLFKRFFALVEAAMNGVVVVAVRDQASARIKLQHLLNDICRHHIPHLQR